ncbi:MAG: hypothetical protein KA170_02295 [Candidatus Promineofilum sp.]|nr:hypothetical protein [Promineifilum sp.]
MRKRESFEHDLARLTAIRADPEQPGADGDLRRALAARSNLLVGRAAEIVGEWALAAYVPELVAAFDHFLEDAVRRDPTCAAKFAIAEALNRLEVRDADLFRRGVGHVQPEPVWGGQEDTAARLRAVCALGLTRSDPPDTLLALAALLADPEADARSGATRAIAYASRPGGAALLWYKAFVGDPEPAVMFECYSALLALEPEAAISLVGRLAGGDDPAQAEAAVLALGSSRLAAVLPLLVELRATASEPSLRRTTLTAIAMLGDDPAFGFLLNLLTEGPPRDAADALGALGLFRDDERRRRKVERAARRRDDLPAVQP